MNLRRYPEGFLSCRTDTILSQKLLFTKFKRAQLKIYITESWFLCSARRPMLVNISMKFHEYIIKVVKLKSEHDFGKRRAVAGQRISPELSFANKTKTFFRAKNKRRKITGP